MYIQTCIIFLAAAILKGQKRKIFDWEFFHGSTLYRIDLYSQRTFTFVLFLKLFKFLRISAVRFPPEPSAVFVMFHNPRCSLHRLFLVAAMACKGDLLPNYK
jgi:hypothetical protein